MCGGWCQGGNEVLCRGPSLLTIANAAMTVTGGSSENSRGSQTARGYRFNQSDTTTPLLLLILCGAFFQIDPGLVWPAVFTDRKHLFPTPTFATCAAANHAIMLSCDQLSTTQLPQRDNPPIQQLFDTKNVQK